MIETPVLNIFRIKEVPFKKIKIIQVITFFHPAFDESLKVTSTEKTFCHKVALNL